MTDLKKEHQRPEGLLIERAMKGPPKMSQRQLAEKIGMSEGRVRQIIAGYQSQAGQVLTIKGPAETVARMAIAVGVSADDLDSAGRADAAEFVREVQSEFSDDARLAEVVMDVVVEPAEVKAWAATDPNSWHVNKPPKSLLRYYEHSDLLDEVGRRYDTLEYRLRYHLQARFGSGGDGDVEESRGAAPMTRQQVELAAFDDPDDPPGTPHE